MSSQVKRKLELTIEDSQDQGKSSKEKQSCMLKKGLPQSNRLKRISKTTAEVKEKAIWGHLERLLQLRYIGSFE